MQTFWLEARQCVALLVLPTCLTGGMIRVCARRRVNLRRVTSMHAVPLCRQAVSAWLRVGSKWSVQLIPNSQGDIELDTIVLYSA